MKSENSEVLGELAYEYIKEQILTKKIACGEKLVESKLEKELGFSRTPVREAIHRLSMDGIVNLYPNRYAEVITFTEESIREFGCVRLNIDCLAAQLAIHNGSNRDFQSLLDIVEKCAEANDAGNLYERIKYDSAFHLALAKLSKNSLLYDFEGKLCMKSRLLQITLLDSPASSICNIDQHKTIVDALIERNTKHVIDLVCAHLCSFYHLDVAEFYVPLLSL